ncbi:flavin-containing monooxygenase [Rhodopila globiformis]|uniref:Cyclohexanone monooxygenase n=1 Tax=Rhodopila globiformis TaxID=1071 RepID=A0A2S6NLY2_RHOGL|nr:NAD(P)/FAD-dependent oxidoreductase [Rhodopila globiformis]PPQ36658.1 cyclohexanone monooxygenase [Rhodopila globiformis]
MAQATTPQRAPVPASVDVVIVGAGFGGMYMLHRLRGLGLSAIVFDVAAGVGGTWYWNRYPGARCDVESMQYSYSFADAIQQEWQWSELFAGQPEILRYANYVADRLDLRRDMRFETRVTAAEFDETASRWTVRTDRGDVVSARFCIMATGCLSAARMPDFPGMDSFTGKIYHTGHWPHEGVDFTGLRVGVIGTGSSAIQSIPVIAAQAKHVTVFQRTPNFSIPSRNGPMPEAYAQSWKQDYAAKRAEARMSRNGIVAYPLDRSAIETPEAERLAIYEQRWVSGGTTFMAAFNDLAVNKASNDTAAEFVRGKIRAMVKDPATADLLAPTNHPIGTKRICVDTDYYTTYNRENVSLVDVRQQPIEALTPAGLRVGEREYAFDAIVFATGFDAMTGALTRMGIAGRDGETLAAKWEAGPRTYLGLMTAGFPNMFMITGPGSPSVLSNMMVSIEQHVDWIADCLASMRKRGLDLIEADLDAEDAWVQHVNDVAHTTLYPAAASWYMGANIPGKPRVFMPYIGGVGAYRQKCDAVAANGYEGFILGEPAPVAVAAE